MTVEMDTLQERFEEFLRTYKDDFGNTIYWSRVQQMSIEGETSLVLNFDDLSSFDLVFLDSASENPQLFLETANNALVSILRIEDPDYVKRIGEDSIQIRIER
jgi:replicative DNA helicase Mcm